MIRTPLFRDHQGTGMEAVRWHEETATQTSRARGAGSGRDPGAGAPGACARPATCHRGAGRCGLSKRGCTHGHLSSQPQGPPVPPPICTHTAASSPDGVPPISPSLAPAAPKRGPFSLGRSLFTTPPELGPWLPSPVLCSAPIGLLAPWSPPVYAPPPRVPLESSSGSRLFACPSV